MEASFKKNLVQPEYLCSLTKEGLWHKMCVKFSLNNVRARKERKIFAFLVYPYLTYFLATVLLVPYD